MPRIINLKVSAKGKLRLPAEFLARWELQDGGAVACLDTGDAVLLVPGGVESLRSQLPAPGIEVDGHDPGPRTCDTSDLPPASD